MFKLPSKRKPNYYYSIFSVALVLFLLGLFGLIVLNANALVRYFKENIEVSVELKNGTAKADITAFEQVLRKANYTKNGSIEFVSKEEGAALMKEAFGDDFAKYGLENPLLDVLHFNVKAAYVTPTELAKIKKELIAKDFVDAVFYEEVQVANVAKNVYKLGGITLLIGICFLFITFMLINNTVRLALYGNRFIIKNMQLVGATEQFIAKPYTVQSIKNGLLSGSLAALGLGGLAYWLYQVFPELVLFQDGIYLLILVFIIILLGVLVSVISTRLSVGRFLKISVEELY